MSVRRLDRSPRRGTPKGVCSQGRELRSSQQRLRVCPVCASSALLRPARLSLGGAPHLRAPARRRPEPLLRAAAARRAVPPQPLRPPLCALLLLRSVLVLRTASSWASSVWEGSLGAQWGLAPFLRVQRAQCPRVQPAFLTVRRVQSRWPWACPLGACCRPTALSWARTGRPFERGWYVDARAPWASCTWAAVWLPSPWIWGSWRTGRHGSSPT